MKINCKSKIGHVSIISADINVTDCHLFGTNPLCNPIQPDNDLDPKEHIALIF